MGRWDDPSRFGLFWSRLRSARQRDMSGKVRSAFVAKFWLDWQMQGLLLPGLAEGLALVVFPAYRLTRPG